MDNILQLKISLMHSKPPIWRRVLVDKSITFADLHEIIQAAMGWYNSHLHEFIVDDQRLSVPYDDPNEYEVDIIDERKVKLNKPIRAAGQKFRYNYDFGDYWEHQIVVEKLLPRDPAIAYPTCIKGKGNCPPEDCGGIYGFYGLLEALADPKHPDHEDMREWVGEDYDPDHFDLAEINQRLAQRLDG
jgi:hypothetical protein